MDLIKIIKFFYTIYTIYVLLVVNTTSLEFMELLPAIILMWMFFLIFSLGYRVKKTCNIHISTNNSFNSWIVNKKKITLIFIGMLSIISSFLVAHFYTGQTPLSTIQGLISDNRSLYYEYQTYAKVQQRGVFSLNKIPFILMMFYIKLILFYSYVSFLLVKEKISKFDKFYLLLITVAHVYFGLARGTNYEFFELVMLIVFVILSRSRQRKTFKIPLINLLAVFLSVSVMVFLFYSRISSRGVNFDFSRSMDFTYDPNGVVPLISPSLSFVTLLVYDYFGFGFFYIFRYITEVWFSSIGNFFAGFIPLGYTALHNTSIQDIIRNYVNMGARWHPDSVIIINNFGFIGLLIICFTLGVFTKYTLFKNNSSLTYLTQFIILLQMISLPIGNFVFISSASTLIVMLVSSIWVWKTFIRVRIKI